MSRNEAGGRDAADELHARIKDYAKKLKLDAENTDITVRAYADLKSLRSACVKNGKMRESSSMSLFAHGFNQRQAMFDFVDVGLGKEAADNKVRGTFILQKSFQSNRPLSNNGQNVSAFSLEFRNVSTLSSVLVMTPATHPFWESLQEMFQSEIVSRSSTAEPFIPGLLN